jgi:hypothetical protein
MARRARPEPAAIVPCVEPDRVTRIVGIKPGVMTDRCIEERNHGSTPFRQLVAPSPRWRGRGQDRNRNPIELAAGQSSRLVGRKAVDEKLVKLEALSCVRESKYPQSSLWGGRGRYDVLEGGEPQRNDHRLGDRSRIRSLKFRI